MKIKFLKLALAIFTVGIAHQVQAASHGENCLDFFGSSRVEPGVICIENLERLSMDDLSNGETFKAFIYSIGTLTEKLTAVVPLTLAVDRIPSMGITSYELTGSSNKFRVYLPFQPSGQKEPFYSHNTGYLSGPGGKTQVINRFVWEESDPPAQPPGWNCHYHCH